MLPVFAFAQTHPFPEHVFENLPCDVCAWFAYDVRTRCLYPRFVHDVRSIGTFLCAFKPQATTVQSVLGFREAVIDLFCLAERLFFTYNLVNPIFRLYVNFDIYDCLVWSHTIEVGRGHEVLRLIFSAVFFRFFFVCNVKFYKVVLFLTNSALNKVVGKLFDKMVWKMLCVLCVWCGFLTRIPYVECIPVYLCL